MDNTETTANPSATNREPATTAGPTGSASKADLTKRIIAGVIDSICAAVLNLAFIWIPMVGGLLAAGYMVARDVLNVGPIQNRSVGKHIMGLQAKRLDGQPMDIETAVKRNWMFGLGAITAVLDVIPFLGTMIALILSPIGLLIVLFEIYNVVTDDEGRRWGDKQADTKVVEV